MVVVDKQSHLSFGGTNKMENSKKIELLHKQIVTESKQIDLNSREKSNKNISIKLPKSDFTPAFLESENIKSVSINNETNSLSLNLYNGFILSVMTKVYDVDFVDLKSRLKATSEFIVFNRLISKEIKNNQKPFLSAL